jgi:hypothetical protein
MDASPCFSRNKAFFGADTPACAGIDRDIDTNVAGVSLYRFYMFFLKKPNKRK